MIANYHTHTTRCRHAVGSDRAYVEAALAAGIRTLGFSDHAPFRYASGYVPTMRMQIDELPEYCASLCALRAEFAGRIELLIGFESEYFPSLFAEQQAIYADHPVDYLILGQHFLDSDETGPYIGRPFSDEESLVRYVDSVLEGAQTGRFRYVCHPDLPNFLGEEAVYRREMRRMCEELAADGLPLEVNILGYREGRQYPSRRFFEIAAECGNSLILGVDAHDPAHFSDPAIFAEAAAFAASFGLPILPSL